MYINATHTPTRTPWNKGKLVGQKRPLRLQEIWEIRFRLESNKRKRDLAMFNLAIDSKLRACDLMRLRVADIAQRSSIQSRARIIQMKTGRPVQFELTEQTRRSLERWIAEMNLRPPDYIFPAHSIKSNHLSRRQYLRILQRWVSDIVLESTVRYLGIGEDDALTLAEQIEVQWLLRTPKGSAFA